MSLIWLARAHAGAAYMGRYKQNIGAVCLSFEVPIGRKGSEEWNGDPAERITRETIMGRMEERVFPSWPRTFASGPGVEG